MFLYLKGKGIFSICSTQENQEETLISVPWPYPPSQINSGAQGMEHYYSLALDHVLTLCLKDEIHGIGSLQKFIVGGFYYPNKGAKMLDV